MPTIDELFKPETKSGYSLDELFSDKSDKNKINIDQLFLEDNKQTLEPSFGLFGGMSNLYSKIDKAQQQKTPLDEAFGGLSNAEIIAGKKKEDAIVSKEKIIDPLAITKEQLKEVWQGELGVTQENKEKLRWLLGDPENSLLGKVNNYLFDRGSAVIDTAIKTGTSVGMIASGLAGDTLNTIYKATGNEPSGVGERLTRDINIALMEFMGRSSGFSNVTNKPGILKSNKTGKEFSNIVDYAKESAENRKEVIQNVNRVFDDEIKVIKENNDVILGDAFEAGNVGKRTQILDEIKSTNEKIAEGIPEIKIEIPKAEVPKIELPKAEIPVETIPKIELPKVEPIAEPIISLDRTPALPIETVKKVTEAAQKFFNEENIILDKKKPISFQIQELWQSGKYDIPTIIRRIAEDNKITPEEFTSFIYPSARKSAQELNALSQLAKKYKEVLDPTNSFDTGTGVVGYIKRLDNIRRALLTSRLSTAVRNYISQSTRVSLDVLQSVIDKTLQQTIRPFVKDKIQFDKGAVSPISNFQGLINNFTQWNPVGGFKKHKEIKTLSNKILENAPREKDRLFLNYASDVKNYGGIKGAKDTLGKVEGIVDYAGIFNKTQEYITRRAVFLARLDEAIRANGKFYKNKTIEQLIQENKLNLIRASDINVAVSKSLETTFAKEYLPNTLPGKIISIINNAPFLLTNIIPFPRFLMNAIKFQYDYSPLPIVTLLSKSEKAKLARGDTSTYSKAAIGMGLLYTGYALRNQSYSGEKWYEFKLGERTVDVRPFNPFAGYLYLGDLYKRVQEGTLRDVDVKGIASVLFGIRGTTGIYVIDSLLDLLASPKVNAESVISFFKKTAGETLAGYLTPLQNFTDVYAQYFPEARAVKETGGSEFTGAFARRFPGSNLPTLTSPTSYIIDANGIPRAAPIYKEDPLVTQVTGLSFIPPKNPAEKELDRLGFDYREIYKSTKIPELDRAYKDKLAVSIGFGLSSIVSTPEYQNMSESFKSLIVKRSLEIIKKEAKEEMQKDISLAPYLVQIKINSLDKDTRKVLDDVVGFDYINDLLKELKKVK